MKRASVEDAPRKVSSARCAAATCRHLSASSRADSARAAVSASITVAGRRGRRLAPTADARSRSQQAREERGSSARSARQAENAARRLPPALRAGRSSARRNRARCSVLTSADGRSGRVPPGAHRAGTSSCSGTGGRSVALAPVVHWPLLSLGLPGAGFISACTAACRFTAVRSGQQTSIAAVTARSWRSEFGPKSPLSVSLFLGFRTGVPTHLRLSQANRQ